ncbi:MAG: 50S ribosomal protein L21 [Desulfatiglandaceae bacterium]
MQAIIKTGGKQYTVAPGDEVKLEKLSGQVGDVVIFDEILMTSDEGGALFGTPFLADSRVTGKILRQGREKKILVFKYKRRKGYRKKRGHRQFFSLVRIDQIDVPEQ